MTMTSETQRDAALDAHLAAQRLSTDAATAERFLAGVLDRDAAAARELDCLLSAHPLEAPEDFAERTIARIEEDTSVLSAPKVMAFPRWLMPVACAAAAAAIAVAVTLSLVRPQTDHAPVQDRIAQGANGEGVAQAGREGLATDDRRGDTASLMAGQAARAATMTYAEFEEILLLESAAIEVAALTQPGAQATIDQILN